MIMHIVGGAVSFKSSRLSERRQRYRVTKKAHRWLSLHGIHMIFIA